MVVRLCLVISLCFVLFHKGLCKGRLRTNQRNDNSIQYFEKVNNITIPIMIHFDKSMALKMRRVNPNRTRNTLRAISRNLLKKVERKFQRPSLNQRIKLKLIDAKFMKRRMTNDTNVSLYLKRYCGWQGERKKLQKNRYFSVLITGLDLYYYKKGKKVWSSTGRGYNGGLCSIYHSCTVLEWKGRNTAFLFSHEIAHSLGIRHDNQHPRCSNKQYIMAREYDPLKSPESWSLCSRMDLQNFLMSKNSQCLRTGFGVHKD